MAKLATIADNPARVKMPSLSTQRKNIQAGIQQSRREVMWVRFDEIEEANFEKVIPSRYEWNRRSLNYS